MERGDDGRGAGGGGAEASELSRFAGVTRVNGAAAAAGAAATIDVSRVTAVRAIRVVSANVLNGQADRVALLEMLDAMGADAVCVQEADAGIFDALAPRFPHGVLGFAPDASALGIALRRPASFAKIELAWRDAEVATLGPEDWPELARPLDLVNLHIAAPHVHNPPLYGFVIRNRQVRALEAHFGRTLAHDHPDQPRSTLLVGDCNATPLWPAYRRIASHFTDAAVAVAQRRGRTLQPTWAPRPTARRRLRLDHAFTRGVTPTDFHVAPITGSDHSAIVVDVVDPAHAGADAAESPA